MEIVLLCVSLLGTVFRKSDVNESGFLDMKKLSGTQRVAPTNSSSRFFGFPGALVIPTVPAISSTLKPPCDTNIPSRFFGFLGPLVISTVPAVSSALKPLCDTNSSSRFFGFKAPL
jgi:hypothetical protein